MENCIIRINEQMDSFSKKEIKIANFILKNADDVAHMSVSELAVKTKCSTATVVRFCNTLGFDGYKDFSKSFYHDVANNYKSQYNSSNSIDNLPGENLTVAQTIEQVSRLNIEAIENSTKVLDPMVVSEVVHLILNSNKVRVYAIGGSSIVAHDAVFKFQRLGIDCEASDTVHSQILSASILKENDVAIFISYSGETKDLITTMEVVRRAKAKTIAITRYGSNSLSRLADVNLHHSAIGKGIRSNSTRSKTVQSNIIDIIFVLLAQKRFDYLKRFYALTDDSFDSSKLSLKEE